jgi:hypothetical protein
MKLFIIKHVCIWQRFIVVKNCHLDWRPQPQNKATASNTSVWGCPALALASLASNFAFFVLPLLGALYRVVALQKLQNFVLISGFLDAQVHPDVRNINSRVGQVHNGPLWVHVVQELEVVERQTFFCLKASFVDNLNLLEFQVNLRRNITKNATQPLLQVILAHTVVPTSTY